MQLPRDNKSLDDPINRKNAPLSDRLAWICEQASRDHGRDPRGGGFSFVGQPQDIEHMVSQLKPGERRMQKTVVIGTAGAEIVAWWIPSGGGPGVPFRCSYKAKGGGTTIWCVPDAMLVPSDQVDRRAAAEIREAIYRGTVRSVQ